MGRLRARGILKLSQFWPEGRADADTANISISLELSPQFVFRPDSGVETVTHVYESAFYNDRGTLKPILGAKGDKLRVRLQGIDAPELHYMPRVKGAKEFRQRLGESAVFALRDMLRDMAAGAKELRADAITFVDKPDDAFDVYGRYVGNLTVYADGFAVDLNHWLLEHGWAVPGLYNSMTERELTVARTLSHDAAVNNWGIYKSTFYKNHIVPFEADLVERHKVNPDDFHLYDDKGDLMNPKIFRRQAEFETSERSKPTGKTFHESLLENDRYKALTWDVFSSLPKAKRKDAKFLKKKSVLLGSLISDHGALPRADDLIYIEDEAGVFSESGDPISEWDFARRAQRAPVKKKKKRAARR